MTTHVRGALAAAVVAVIGAGFLAPAFADPTQVCIGLSDDRRGICFTTDRIPPPSVPVSPR